MPKTFSGSEILLESLVRQKVEVIFGLPGGAILPPYSFKAGRPQPAALSGRFPLDPARSVENTCFKCHMDVRGQFNLPNHHPVPEGRMSCIQCHPPHKGIAHAGGCYRAEHARISISRVYTNNLPGGQMRAPGEPQGFFAAESHIDCVARKLGMDPCEFRMKNLIEEGDLTLTGGLRYNLYSPPWETNGLQVAPSIPLGDWFATRQQNMLKGVPDNVLPPLTLDLAGPANGKQGFYEWDYTKFGPRCAAAVRHAVSTSSAPTSLRWSGLARCASITCATRRGWSSASQLLKWMKRPM